MHVLVSDNPTGVCRQAGHPELLAKGRQANSFRGEEKKSKGDQVSMNTEKYYY